MGCRKKRQKAEIHDYDGHSLDENGELLLGFYWRLLDADENPTTELMGPYTTFHECQAALEAAYQTHDY